MKRMIFLLSLLFGLCSCESSPEVTSCIPLMSETPEYTTDYSGNVVFKGKKHTVSGWVHWDENKECPNKAYSSFRTTKSSPSAILLGDRCDNCGFTWKLHK